VEICWAVSLQEGGVGACWCFAVQEAVCRVDHAGVAPQSLGPSLSPFSHPIAVPSHATHTTLLSQGVLPATGGTQEAGGGAQRPRGGTRVALGLVCGDGGGHRRSDLLPLRQVRRLSRQYMPLTYARNRLGTVTRLYQQRLWMSWMCSTRQSRTSTVHLSCSYIYQAPPADYHSSPADFRLLLCHVSGGWARRWVMG
jgi:hypothetical protein